MLPIRKLEMHASHACNLTCESCSHLTNHAHPGIITVEEADRQLGLWSHRIAPKLLILCGGEPTLNPRLADLVRLAHRRFPAALIEVTSNGFFLERHPELPPALMPRGRLVLSHHSDEPDYLARFNRAERLARAWAERGLCVVIRRMAGQWIRRYDGYGPSMLPLGRGETRSAWEECNARRCFQLHDGYLWKCPFVAYMPMQVARFPNLASTWRAMLEYRPLDPAAGDEDLAEFLAREEEACCALCPSVSRHFDPRAVLTPAAQLLKNAQNGTIDEWPANAIGGKPRSTATIPLRGPKPPPRRWKQER